jgi:transposase
LTSLSIRFESEPGDQMQIDFGEKKVPIGGRLVKVHLLVAVLGYSRRTYVKAFPRRTADPPSHRVGRCARETLPGEEARLHE